MLELFEDLYEPLDGVHDIVRITCHVWISNKATLFGDAVEGGHINGDGFLMVLIYDSEA